MVKTVRDNNHIGLFDALTVVSTEQEKEAIQRFFTKAQTAADESVSGTTVLNVLFGDGAYFVTRKASWTQAQIPNGAVFPIRSLRPGR